MGTGAGGRWIFFAVDCRQRQDHLPPCGRNDSPKDTGMIALLRGCIYIRDIFNR